ncbi:perforin-1-like [Chiloscyllium punctatum]|uniref:perforin-1-like n=1 Tax=Chiloscyllium punctatum TaxID=137246 RepID=UPI003B63EAE2
MGKGQACPDSSFNRDLQTAGAEMPAVHLKPGCFLFLYLFFQDALSICTIGNASECRDANVVPGARLAGLGYDMVTLQPKGASVIDVNTWHSANGSCTLCRNEHLGNARQRLPVSLVDWRTLSSCRRSLSSGLDHSAAELSRSATSDITNDWRADLILPPKPGTGANLVLAGSKSKLVEFGTTRSKSDRYSFASHQLQCLYYQFRVKAQPLLAPEFTRSLARLPTVWNDDTKYQYKKLVDTYGTHYLKSVELGGRYKSVTAIRTCEAASEGYSAEEVKDCLSLDAHVTLRLSTKSSAGYQKCKDMARTMKHNNVYQAFSDRETELRGGRARQRTDLFFSGDSSAFTSWLESLSTHPGMGRYALEPLHHLLPNSDPRHAILRRYISDYIAGDALSLQCTRCPHGSYHHPHQPCSCLCRGETHVDRNCCSKGKGLGRLVVTVREGRDLRGDAFSKTDGYVVVKYGEAEARTSMISNNQHPQWNAELDLGEVKAESGHELTIEVWDQDAKRDDLLGTCQVPLTSGTHGETCFLKYGKVTYGYTFTCGPHLGGATCRDYMPSPAE